MIRNHLLASLLLFTVTLSGPALAAAEATLHQVYEAANSGRLSEAQTMMDKVLQNHPNSAKAHFVDAELLAKQGRLASAAHELSVAEGLAPGLPFAKPDAVEKLRHRISSSPSPVPAQSVLATAAPSQSTGAFPWAMLLMGVGLVAALVYFLRSLRTRGNSLVYPAGSGTAYGPGYGSGMPMQPYGPGGGAPGMGPAAGGMGSGILGGLATGAAVGAGIVAGEALMHHFTDGNRQGLAQTSDAFPAPSDDSIALPDDMGGNDFGVSDASSWDDSSSGGDWD